MAEKGKHYEKTLWRAPVHRIVRACGGGARDQTRLNRLGVKVKMKETGKSQVVKEFPKKEGYYWHKNEFNGDWQVVEAWRNALGHWMMGNQLTDENYMENFVTDETVWCGPIPEPPSE